jgi:WD40 repeat protein
MIEEKKEQKSTSMVSGSSKKTKKIDSGSKPIVGNQQPTSGREDNLLENENVSESIVTESDKEEYELVGHSGPVFSVAISVCDKHLLSGSYDNTIRRWSL